uniref:Uncharacterized protein n=1 Tax=Arundo donax TaxID=35708 RepID=A0A0A9SCR8_ARUDO
MHSCITLLLQYYKMTHTFDALMIFQAFMFNFRKELVFVFPCQESILNVYITIHV